MAWERAGRCHRPLLNTGLSYGILGKDDDMKKAQDGTVCTEADALRTILDWSVSMFTGF